MRNIDDPQTDEERLEYLRVAMQGILSGAVSDGLIRHEAAVLALYGTMLSAARKAFLGHDPDVAFREEIENARLMIVRPIQN